MSDDPCKWAKYEFNDSHLGSSAILNPEICSKLYDGINKWAVGNRSLMRRYSGETVEIVELLGCKDHYDTAKVRTFDGAEIYVRRVHLIRANGRNGRKSGGRQSSFGGQ